MQLGASKPVRKLAHDDQQLEVRGFLDESALGFVLVGLGRLAVPQDVLRVGVKLIAFVAVRRLQHNRSGLGLERCDDAAVLAEARVLKEPIVVARLGRSFLIKSVQRRFDLAP